MGGGKALTEDMVLMRTKCDRFDLIKNLNLWGNDLVDVSVIRKMSNLRVLSLPVNQISSLTDLAHCPRLNELYLRRNSVKDLAEIKKLQNLTELQVLWLSENPVASLPHYRAYILHHLPNLRKIDAQDVTPEERRMAQQMDPNGVVTVAAYDDDVQSEVSGHGSQMQEQAHLERRHSADFQRSPPKPQHHLERRHSGPADFAGPENGPRRNVWQVDEAEGGMEPPFHQPRFEEQSPRGQRRWGGAGGGMDGTPGSKQRPGGGAPTNYVVDPDERPIGGSPQKPRGMSKGSSGGERMMRQQSGQQKPPSPDESEEGDLPLHGNGRAVARPHNGSPVQMASGHPGEHQWGGMPPPRGSPQNPRHPQARDAWAEQQPHPFEGGSPPRGGPGRGENILCAVLALINELDGQGLELVRRAIEQRQGQ